MLPRNTSSGPMLAVPSATTHIITIPDPASGKYRRRIPSKIAALTKNPAYVNTSTAAGSGNATPPVNTRNGNRSVTTGAAPK